MTDPERDARVSERYRALGREEPPSPLDAAILAASRRRRSRWAVPVSVAAVVVLAVGVTLRVQIEERKDAEEIALSPRVIEAPAEMAARPSQRIGATPPAAAPPMALESRAQELQAGARKRETLAEAAADRAEPAGRASAGASVAVGKISKAPETPEQWLERIARLRDAGKAREADESLAAFRKRYPDFRIPEKLRARVVPR